MNRRDRTILEKICGYCAEVERTHEYFKHDKDLFFDRANGFVYRNSITMPILQIGELAKKLSEEFRNSHRDIPWREVMGMRDIFAHHYGSLDYDIVWNTSVSDVSGLENSIRNITEGL